jgi:hypothetical protein
MWEREMFFKKNKCMIDSVSRVGRRLWAWEEFSLWTQIAGLISTNGPQLHTFLWARREARGEECAAMNLPPSLLHSSMPNWLWTAPHVACVLPVTHVFCVCVLGACAARPPLVSSTTIATLVSSPSSGLLLLCPLSSISPSAFRPWILIPELEPGSETASALRRSAAHNVGLQTQVSRPSINPHFFASYWFSSSFLYCSISM